MLNLQHNLVKSSQSIQFIDEIPCPGNIYPEDPTPFRTLNGVEKWGGSGRGSEGGKCECALSKLMQV